MLLKEFLNHWFSKDKGLLFYFFPFLFFSKKEYYLQIRKNYYI